MSDEKVIRHELSGSKPQPAEQWLGPLYGELRSLAAHKMSREGPDHTLQPTALVHEVWLRLSNNRHLEFNDSRHFFATASAAMKQILVDHARRKKSLKRGAGAERINLDDVDIAAKADCDTLLRINEALEKLGVEDPQAAELVNLRFFGGLTNAQSAQVLGISERSAKRYWTFARAWLYRELAEGQDGG